MRGLRALSLLCVVTRWAPAPGSPTSRSSRSTDPWESPSDTTPDARQSAELRVHVRHPRRRATRTSHSPTIGDARLHVGHPESRRRRRALAAQRPHVLPDQLRRLPRRSGQGRRADPRDQGHLPAAARWRIRRRKVRRIHLGHHPQWPRRDAVVQPHRRAGSVGRRELRPRTAGEVHRSSPVPSGLPGETGDKVPGFTQMGPNRPAPYYHTAGSQAAPMRRALCPPQSVRRRRPPHTTTTKTGGER